MNIKYAAVPIILSLICACSPLDIIERKKSDAQVRHEAGLPVQNVWAEPVNLADGIAPVALYEPQPECQGDVFRVSRCVDGRIAPW